MRLKIKKSERLGNLPPYLFAEIDKAKKEALEQGRDIIDLGVGDPDQATPQYIIEALYEAAKDPSNHHYAASVGLSRLRQAIAKWYKKRFNVELDPEKEVLSLMGSKEGIAHMPLAFVNPGDTVLIPDPSYPPYRGGTILAGGIPCSMPLLAENKFLPDLEKISPKTAKKAKLMFLNYPNNPTAAVADKAFFARVVEFARRHNIIVCHDAAYSEIAFDGYRPPSFLEVDGARDVGVEFHSFSKTYSMTGWRIGFVSGNSEIINHLREVKSNIDSGVFQAVQLAAVAALEGDTPSRLEALIRLYKERRDVLVDGLNSLGWQAERPKASFCVWAPVPSGFKNSVEFARFLLDKADIIVTPGVGFGAAGEGYFRMALTVPRERLEQAIERIKGAI